MTYDPADDLSQVDVPVLALFAEHDDVVIAEQNVSSLEDALSHNEAVTTEVVPDVNHLFLPAETANPSEWTALSTELSMSLLDRIRQWMLTTGLA
jgi:dienelactone hydrolase